MDSHTGLAPGPPPGDRRVRRSRAALMRAAVELVTERATSAVTVSDLAAAADVSRQVAYTQFGDRDTLLLEAALDLVRRELIPVIAHGPAAPTRRARILAAARHFASHRPFYRAMFTGPRAHALTKALSVLLAPSNRPLVDHFAGGSANPDVVEDLTAFVTGGWSAIVTTWVVDGDDPLDPDEMTDRLLRLGAALTGGAAPA